MITVAITRAGNMLTLDFKGHAGFAEKGKDIVCAGVSALYFVLTEGVCRQAPQAVTVRKTRRVELDLSVQGVYAIAEATVTGLLSIAGSYPGYLSVRNISGQRCKASAKE